MTDLKTFNFINLNYISIVIYCCQKIDKTDTVCVIIKKSKTKNDNNKEQDDQWPYGAHLRWG